MDFLKSAVASAISKSSSFPYSFDGKVDVDQSVWTLYNSTKRVRERHCVLTVMAGLTQSDRRTAQSVVSSRLT